MCKIFLWAFVFLGSFSGAQELDTAQCPDVPESLTVNLVRQIINDEISKNSIKKIKIYKDFFHWDTSAVRLQTQVLYNRDSSQSILFSDEFSRANYIYMQADSLFTKSDKEYINCQIKKHINKNIPNLVKTIEKELINKSRDSNYVAFSYPLYSENFKFAIVREFRPIMWIEGQKKFTHSFRTLYYKNVSGKWRNVLSTGIFY